MKINGNAVAEGTVIHGTLRTEDLMRAFRDEIRRLCAVSPDCCWEADAWLEGRETYREYHEIDFTEEECEEYGDILVGNLMDHLDRMAPKGWYFGAYEGDGSDFGWWRNSDEDE